MAVSSVRYFRNRHANPYIKLRYGARCEKDHGSGVWSTTATLVSSTNPYGKDEHSSSEEWHAECYRQGGLVGVVYGRSGYDPGYYFFAGGGVRRALPGEPSVEFIAGRPVSHGCSPDRNFWGASGRSS